MVRRPKYAVKIQEIALATKPRHELMRFSSKARLWLIPASVNQCQSFVRITTHEWDSRSKKKVAWLAIRFPAKFCDAYIKHTMTVRRKSVPLQRSSRLGSPPICRSISAVRSRVANVCRDCSSVCPIAPRRLIDLKASSLRPLRTSHHGDSGERKMRIRSGVYQGHL
jgi:hypothetical protein